MLHVSLLTPCKAQLGEGAVQADPLPWLVDEQGEPHYEIKAVLGHQCAVIAKMMSYQS